MVVAGVEVEVTDEPVLVMEPEAVLEPEAVKLTPDDELLPVVVKLLTPVDEARAREELWSARDSTLAKSVPSAVIGLFESKPLKYEQVDAPLS
jgi:hypothetical protein